MKEKNRGVWQLRTVHQQFNILIMAASRALLTFCNFRHFPGHKHRIVHVSTSCTLLNTSSFNPGTYLLRFSLWTVYL